MYLFMIILFLHIAMMHCNLINKKKPLFLSATQIYLFRGILTAEFNLCGKFMGWKFDKSFPKRQTGKNVDAVYAVSWCIGVSKVFRLFHGAWRVLSFRDEYLIKARILIK